MTESSADARLRRMAGDLGVTPPSSDAPSPTSSYALLAFMLGAICLMLRLQNIMALPIFGDEAIYLRWAQLIREGHWWVSLADPKPPLHFWLIALVYRMGANPLLPARVISAVAGALSIPAVMAVCVELGRFGRKSWGPAIVTGRAVGAIVGILFLFNPFLAFYQRFATADALFVLEMLLAVWASLAWARGVWAGRGFSGALAMGLAMGAAMMTRQGLSYTLWGLPVAAVGLRAVADRSGFGRRLLRAAAQFVFGGVVAGVLWSPFLLARLPEAIADARAELAPATRAAATAATGTAPATAAAKAAPSDSQLAIDIIKHRILYQDKFSQAPSWEARKASIERLSAQTFSPTWTTDRGQTDEGWLWMYLTPPVYVAGMLGLVWLMVRGQGAIALLLLAWLVLMLGPVIVLGSVVYSRYVLAGGAVLVVIAGWAAADLLSLAFAIPRKGRWAGWLAAVAILAGMSWMAVREIGRQINHWQQQTLNRKDTYQYLTGWSAGKATMDAIKEIARVARLGQEQFVVITDTAWGLPADAAWVYLKDFSNVRLYWTSRSGEPILIPAGAPYPADTYWLRPEKWLFLPQEPVHIEPGTRVFYMTNDPVVPSDPAHRATKVLGKLNPNLPPPWTFYGIEGAVSDNPATPGADDQVDVFPLR